MPLPRSDYVPQLAIVGNARLRGLVALRVLTDSDPADWILYIAVGSRLAQAACDAHNAALNASA
ncbi:hypothetical protein D7V80_12390 [Corallococcus sp. CA054B]|uniref:hypothetical protein n=1 Tax=Corallococcus sp. CA054B TaxID=2316734 RepID=UPI000EA3860C|nr:hypothetical protein [Corallococcus sp. CA054B]RKG68422.1 hypothetical protein D7V80_12390 [Corallococcus sp. CA054B]